MNEPSRFSRQLLSASQYVLALHPPEDCVAVLVRNRVREQTMQRILAVEAIASSLFMCSHSTQHYARINPTKLARSYTDAAYVQRNIRTIEVLIDQEVVRSGTADSEPWRFYDLGHGYCTYDFFDQCPHLMACARCGFYRPKNSAAAHFLEGKKNLLRLQQDIPLTEAEANAVVDGVSAFDKLLALLSDVPTPEGPTSRQLQSGLVQIKPTNEGSK